MTVIPLRPDTARSLRDRLYRPQNGRSSSELDIVSGTAARDRRAELLQQQEDIKRAKADFRRQTQLDDMMRKIVENHVRAKKIAARVYLEDAEMAPPTMKRIVKHVAAAHNMTPVDILSRRRTTRLSLARQTAMYLARTLTFRSFPEIGAFLGGRDHTTVMHGVRQIEDRMKADTEFRDKIKGFELALAQRE